MGKSRALNFLYGSRGDSEPLRISNFRLDAKPSEPTRTNLFSIYRVESGSGSVAIDAACHAFASSSLVFAIPYQYVRFLPDGPIAADVIQFHANFLCVETFHAEVGCSGTLFNDPYGVPVLPLEAHSNAEVANLFGRIRREDAEREKAYADAALAYLKVLLILATRLKATADAACCVPTNAIQQPLLAQLRELIEANYHEWHSPADYAKALHVTPKTLGRLVRDNLGTTLTDLIRGRILTHAKWEILHTLRPIKEIASEIGFADELYFSRLFKKATGVSPTYFREFETRIRNGSNLSISSVHPSIQSSSRSAEN